MAQVSSPTPHRKKITLFYDKYSRITAMAEPIRVPLIPAAGSTEAAMAGVQGIVFTATDRKLIEDRTGAEINKTSTFLEAMSKKQSITDRIEDEHSEVNSHVEIGVKPPQDVKGLKRRIKDHDRIIKYSNITAPHERVEITGITPEAELAAEERPTTDPAKTATPPVDSQPHSEMIAKTTAIAKELNLNPAELFDKFALEQSQLFSLVAKIKDLHLKRLLAGSRAEFESFSDEIKRETLASVREEARDWLDHQLDGLTRGAAEYKLNLLKSLQSMHYDDRKNDSVQWLRKVIDKLAKPEN
ncbi:MAG: hypothetical protein WC601_00095 [Desulfotomaculaceae bacterium]